MTKVTKVTKVTRRLSSGLWLPRDLVARGCLGNLSNLSDLSNLITQGTEELRPYPAGALLSGLSNLSNPSDPSIWRGAIAPVPQCDKVAGAGLDPAPAEPC